MFRRGQRISQTRLGKAIGVTFQQVQKYERGTNRISASTLYKIAQFLNLSMGDFFDDLSDPGTLPNQTQTSGFSDTADSNVPFNPFQSRESIDLIQDFTRIENPAVRRRLHKLVRSIANE